MRRKLWGIFVMSMALFALLTGLVSAQDEAGLPGLADLDSDWNTLVPGGETVCSNETEFQFYVRPAESDKLLIYLNGGGACWFGQICDLTLSPTYSPFADGDGNDPSARTGIFDFDNPENPVADYNMVFIPYCTGDVHLGANEAVYTVPVSEESEETRDLTIQHKGLVNGQVVLDWVFANFEAPEHIFVTGSSAGAIPSPLYASLVAEHYPDVRITQLGDGAGGYRAPEAVGIINSAWGTVDALPDFPEYEGETVETLVFEDHYIVAGTRYPNMVLAQYNTAEDDVQHDFLGLLGITDISLQDLMEANFADISASVDNFYTFTAGGELHTILRAPEMYTYGVSGVRFVDWLAALVAGDPMENLTCGDDCLAPEIISGE